jgi:5-methyltetrahydrofolate--homocysteine methyltransferase
MADKVRGLKPRVPGAPPVQTKLAGLEPFTMAA